MTGMAAPRRRRLAAAVAAAVLAAATTPTGGGAQGGGLTTLLDTKREVTARLARAARAALLGNDRCASLATCASSGGCSYAACGWEFDDTLRCTPRAASPQSGCGGDGCGAIKIANRTGFVRVAAGTELSTDGLVPLAVYQETCLLRSLDALFVRQAADTVPWAYFGTANGVHRIYPGVRRTHLDDGTCRPYDPRLRPWYASAASGPLDVAIVVDRSAAMGTTVTPGGRSVMEAASAAVDGLLGTLDWSSYVGVVRYNDAAEELVSLNRFVQATREKVGLLQSEAASSLSPAGGVNVSAALGTAFDLFERSAAAKRSSGCTRVLFWLTGTNDDCYARECGPDARGPCTCTSTVVDEVRRRQAALVAADGIPVTIIVLSFGGASDALARQLTCGGAVDAQGLVVPIEDDGGNLVTAMAPAYRWLSTARRRTPLAAGSVFFSESYEDDGGFGVLTTAALPVYDNAGALLGVAGVDIPLAELRRRSPSAEDAVAELSAVGTCSRPGLTSCEQQALRAPAAGVCAQQLPHALSRCFSPPGGNNGNGTDNDDGGGVVWVTHLDPADALPAAAAAAACARLTPDGSGRLATGRSAAAAVALAGVLGVDRTWVGAFRRAGGGGGGGGGDGGDGGYVWVLGGNRTAPVTYTGGWPRGEAPRPGEGAGDCVTADRRGVGGAWAPTPCTTAAVYVCELPGGAAAALPSVCGDGGVTVIGDAPVAQTVNPPVARCPVAAAGPPTCAAVPERQRRPFCPLGAPGDDCADRCCAGCTCTLASSKGDPREGGGGGGEEGGGLGPAAIAGVVVGGLVGAAIVAALGWFLMPWIRRCVGGGGADNAAKPLSIASEGSAEGGVSGGMDGEPRGVSVPDTWDT
ncbi:hypothetical protein BU14_0065s0038 [Porphyra umbilicalis]|uniref:C-type lectin domain-containing protein n=1 Tax=Porphyra umbilicalis TaxID=2786 RepID=A0A1X6PH68_PORUM|nr:hypothetical protein BU14_0065s0038 [Porphyra umbilicalis]|eukprot:OSX80033.1 hypothetical protein BU14_0065s0038 [Porphyra umbilicalis]